MKSPLLLVLIVIPVILGSMAISIGSVNNLIHVYTPTEQQVTSNTAIPSNSVAPNQQANNNQPSTTSTNNGDVVNFYSTPWEMNWVPTTTKSIEAPVIGAVVERSSPSLINVIENAVPQARSYLVSKFTIMSGSSFGIANSNSESQIFLITTVGPSNDLFIEGIKGASQVYHVTYSNKWLVEIKQGVGTIQISSVNGNQRAVGVEVERILSLEESQFSFPPLISGVENITTEIREKKVTALSSNEPSSTHYTWALLNLKEEPIVYLIKLDTNPQLWINLEIIDKSANRVFQYTEQGYFLVEINAHGKGKFQSAVSGSSFTITNEVSQIT